MAPTVQRAIKHIEFVPIDSNRALVVIVDTLGASRKQINRYPKGNACIQFN